MRLVKITLWLEMLWMFPWLILGILVGLSLRGYYSGKRLANNVLDRTIEESK